MTTTNATNTAAERCLAEIEKNEAAKVVELKTLLRSNYDQEVFHPTYYQDVKVVRIADDTRVSYPTRGWGPVLHHARLMELEDGRLIFRGTFGYEEVS